MDGMIGESFPDTLIRTIAEVEMLKNGLELDTSSLSERVYDFRALYKELTKQDTKWKDEIANVGICVKNVCEKLNDTAEGLDKLIETLTQAYKNTIEKGEN